MEIQQLRCFVTVAETLNFRVAAERLHLVQPAVSQQLRRLESSLGLRLFDRSTRHVALTDDGTRLLPEARAVLAAVEGMRRTATSLTEERPQLRLGTPRATDDRVLRLLERLADRAPEIRVLPRRDGGPELLAAVRSGGLDAAIVRTVTQAPGLELTELWTEALMVALPAGHEAAAKPELSLDQLAELPLRIAPAERNAAFHDLIIGACRASGFEPVLGPAFESFQQTLVAIGADEPSWTVFYPIGPPPDYAPVAFRPLTTPASITSLATKPDPPPRPVQELLAAAAELT